MLANKLEGDSWDYDGSPVLENLEEVSRVGFGDAMPISALQGDGLAQLAVTIEELQAIKRQEMGLSEAGEGMDADLDVSLDD